MRRFFALLAFELRYYLRRPSTHVYFLIYFAIAVVLALMEAGAFPSGTLGLAGAGGQVKANSPFVVHTLVMLVSLVAPVIIAAVSGNAAHRDFQAGMHPLVFTSPIGKTTYIAGRYVASFIVCSYILASIPIGIFVAEVSPKADPERLQAFHAWHFVYPFLVTILPLAIFVGAVFFVLAALTRQMLPNYLGGAAMIVGWTLAASFAGDTERQHLAALLDPFGVIPASLSVRYWTPVERNSQVIPLTGDFLANRIIWALVAVAVVGLATWRFKFKHVANERMESRRQRARWEEASSDWHAAQARGAGLPDAPRAFGAAARLAQFASTLRLAGISVLRSVYFYAIVGMGCVFLFFASLGMDQIYGTATWPVTRAVVDILVGSFTIFVLIVLTLYAGELTWQERDARMEQVSDVTSTPSWVLFAAKFSALLGVAIILNVFLAVIGMSLQIGRGYTHLEPDIYLSRLFGIQMIETALTIAAVMLIHVLANNKYLGHLLAIVLIVGNTFMGALGFEHLLYRYGSDSGTPYSDMNEFGPFLAPYGWLKLYWTGVALLFAVLTHLFWPRGQETGFGWRLALARQRVSRPIVAFGAAGLALAAVVGAFIFWNTNVRNEYRTSFEQQAIQARYERDYKQYEDLPQPRITKSSVDVTLWPKAATGELKGTLTAVNKTAAQIPTLHVLIPVEADVRKLELDPPAKETKNDEEMGYRIFTLDQPLQPGQTLTLAYDLRYAPKGFTNSGVSTTIVENGTFLNSRALPSFGYSANGELSDDDTRRKHGLPPKERMADVDDLQARRNTYISHDADWIDFDAVVCTDPDQRAIAPGYLEEEFDRGDRRCFRYAMDAPILNFYAFLSGRYEIKKDAWHDVAIEVWYHHDHAYNVDRMIDASRKALEYYTVEIGPYQHRQLRIVEFPRYASFAQSFPNTVPYSESIGFIARVRDPAKDIDYPFYVTAHEIAHQWFAHQIIGGDVQGSTLLSESLSQYAALKVMEKEFGADQIGKFLRYEMDRYLSGRALERKKELPLLLVENQQYIHYNKGSVVLFALSELLGSRVDVEDTKPVQADGQGPTGTEVMNAAIRSYLGKVKFQGPPYTNSLEFLAELRAVTPPDRQYLLDDMIASITLYDTRTVSAETEKGADGRFTTTVQITARKVRADEKGNEVEVPMDDLVDVGVYLEGKRGKVYDMVALTERRVRLKSGDNTFTFVTTERPEKAGVDKRLLLIDRHLDDNVVKVKDAKAGSA